MVGNSIKSGAVLPDDENKSSEDERGGGRRRRQFTRVHAKTSDIKLSWSAVFRLDGSIWITLEAKATKKWGNWRRRN